MSGTFDKWLSTQHLEDYSKEELAKRAWKESFEKNFDKLINDDYVKDYVQFCLASYIHSRKYRPTVDVTPTKDEEYNAKEYSKVVFEKLDKYIFENGSDFS
jgi:hypothetical protein